MTSIKTGNTKKLNVTFDAIDSDRFPVYCKYPLQCQAQPAFIELDIETGECTADYNRKIGNAIPFSVWHNRKLRFSIAPEMRNNEIAELIDSLKDEFQKILNGASVEWDGSNNIGRFNDESQRCLDDLNEAFSQCYFGIAESSMINEESFADWLGDDVFPSTGQSVEEFADKLYSLDGESDCWFSDNINSPDAILSQLKCVWTENHLYQYDSLPQDVAKHLLDDGYCDDSYWLDELKRFTSDKSE